MVTVVIEDTMVTEFNFSLKANRYRIEWTMLQHFLVAVVDSERQQLSDTFKSAKFFIGGVKQGANMACNS